VAVGAAAIVAVSAATARAEVTSFAIERFSIATSEGALLGIEGARPSEPGTWTLGMWMGVEHDPLVVSTGDLRTGALVEQRVGGELGATFVAARHFEVSMRLPIIVAQRRDAMVPGIAAELGELGTGLGDLAVAPKLIVLAQERHGVDAAVVASFTLPTGTARDYVREGFTLSPSIVLGRRDGRVRLAAELGYALRPTTEMGASVVDDELFAHAGGAVGLHSRVELAATVSFATSASDPSTGHNYIEVVAGPTAQLGAHATAFAAGGFGLQDGFGTPDWRALAGVRFAPR
jgi:hypothetical protein